MLVLPAAVVSSGNIFFVFMEVRFMKQQIKNNLENVTIEGGYTGGNTFINNYYSHQTEKCVQKNHNNKTIFLSYNWHDAKMADRIDKYLSGCSGVTVKRDIRDIGAWKSIREFMKSIRDQDYAVLIVSDSYLKSKNCMFEVVEMMKEQKYGSRIFPAVVEQCIYDPLARAEYIGYWQRESDKLEAAIMGLEPVYSAELLVDLKYYKNIASSIGEFLSMVVDMNNPNVQDVEVQIENAILKN